MSLSLKGLSRSDVHSYYNETILKSKEGLFKVESFRDKTFTGYLLTKGVWVPHAATEKELSIAYPKEGYVMIKGNIYIICQTLRRTRRKGFTAEGYALNPKRGDVKGLGIVTATELPEVFKDGERKTYKEVEHRLKKSTVKGTVLSKELCIRRSGKIKYVWLRG